jgi:hypothetical protein
MTSDPIPANLRADLWIDTPTVGAASAEFACRLSLPDGETHNIWFRFPPETAPLLTRMADPFVVAVLLHAMTRCRELVVHGDVSAALILNLCNFQEAFCAFHGGTYHPVRIEADRVVQAAAKPGTGRAITAFSGGVDSAFSIYLHTSRSRIVPKRPLCAALLMQGLDLTLEEPSVFARVANRCRTVTDDAGIALHTGATNLRTLPVPWDDQFGTAVAASLLFFQGTYSQGLIPSAYTYGLLHPEHGSNPLTDPLLSSPLLAIIHDGAAYGRIDKLRELATWPAALAKLRVCWQPGRSENCGKCEKCVRTQLMLELCGVEACAAFPGTVSPDELGSLVIRTSGGLHELSYLLREARISRPNSPWIGPLSRAVARNRRYLRLQAAAREAGDTIPSWLRAGAGSVAKRIFAQPRPAPTIKPAEPRAGLPLSKPST